MGEQNTAKRRVFLSDLDNTLIYSYKHNIGDEKTCVEIYQGREISFMTDRSYHLLKKVKEKVLLVPVTTRTREQYDRIDLGIGTPEYALVCNGGVLLVNGQEDEEWYENSLELIHESRRELVRGMRYLAEDEHVNFEIRNIRELFLFTKSAKPEESVRRLREGLDLSLVEVFSNGVKVYVLPKKLSKGRALQRFRERIGAECVIAAGDSEFDIPMLRKAEIAFLPEELEERCEVRSHSFGIADRGNDAERTIIFSDGLLQAILELE